MALNKNKLQTDLAKVFSDMKDAGENASDDDFAEGIAKAVKAFGEGGSVSTSDSGTVSSGSFVGSGSGSLSLTDSDMSTPIKTACTAMKAGSGDDNTLATAIGAGILAMTSKQNVVSTSVTGTTTNPSGSVVPPSSGSAKGTITCDNSDLIQGLKDTFSDMKSKAHDEGFNGDTYLAQQLADLTYDYFKNGSIETKGQGALSGTTGTGSIS